MGANRTFSSLLRFYFSILALTVSANNKAQISPKDTATTSLSLGVKYYTGFIIPHSESIRSISNSNPWGIEANVSWHFTDVNSQSYCNCFPRLGVALSYINFDNPSILGEGFSIAPFVEPFITPWKKISYSIRFSIGAAYLNNIYDPVTNPQNLFYSKHLSYILSLTPSIYYNRFTYWKLYLSGSYNHISNGGNRQPNKGINFPTVSLGVEYIFTPVNFSKVAVTPNVANLRKNRIGLAILGTAKVPSFETNRRKALIGISFVYSRRVGRMNNLLAGAEFISDGALKAELKQNIPANPDHKRVALLAGHELSIGRFAFSQQLGAYVYSPAKAKDPVYQRWGLDYYLTDSFFFGANLKAHRHVADFLDFRVGYRF